MSRPTVSLIIPFYNRERYLQRTLQSIAAQRYTNYELLLVDNASTDNGVDVCLSWMKVHTEIQCSLFRCDKHGASAARNVALRQAQGQFVYFFDSDDEIDPNYLHDASTLFAKADLIFSSSSLVFKDGRSHTRTIFRHGTLRDHVLCSMINTQAMLARRSLFEEVGGWDENLPSWNDWEIAIRLFLRAEQGDVRIAWLSKTYHRIHQHPDSITGLGWAATADNIESAIDKAEKLFAQRPRERRAAAARRTMIAAKLLRSGRLKKGWRWLRRACHTDWHQALFFPYTLLVDRGSWRIFRSLFP